jgi:urease accessory protein
MNLALLQLGDSALPIGGYSHSWGLEAAVTRGLVSDAPTLERWARCWLRYAAAPAEGVVVAAACRAATVDDWPQVRSANELLAASLTPPTLRAASCNMGEHLLTLAEAWPWAAETAAALRRIEAESPWHHAPVFGALAAAGGASSQDAVLIYLHQAALGVVGAGVKAVPIGHSHGQQILARLHDELYALAEEMAVRPLEDAGAFCPAYEVLCHEQSCLYTRLFRS